MSRCCWFCSSGDYILRTHALKGCLNLVLCQWFYFLHRHNTWKRKSLSSVQLFATPWTVACQAPLSMEFSRQEHWSGQLFPSPGDLLNPGIEPRSSGDHILRTSALNDCLNLVLRQWFYGFLYPHNNLALSCFSVSCELNGISVVVVWFTLIIQEMENSFIWSLVIHSTPPMNCH